MPIRIANWNLDHAKELWRRAAICEQIKKIEAEVWILTETRDSVRPGEHFECVARSEPRPGAGKDESWVSIWSSMKFRCKNEVDDSEFSACATVELKSGMPLTIFGTVLPWRGSVWRGEASAGAVAYEAALQLQQKDWSKIFKQRGGALCVAGDLNQDLQEKSYYWSYKAQCALKKALASVPELKAVTAGQNDPVLKISKGTKACIDHICISKNLRVTAKDGIKAWLPEWNGRTLSDHPGVWVEITDI